jgi:hypothetical protein
MSFELIEFQAQNLLDILDSILNNFLGNGIDWGRCAYFQHVNIRNTLIQVACDEVWILRMDTKNTCA